MGIGINIAGTGIGLTQTIMNQKNKQTGQYDEVSGRVTHCTLHWFDDTQGNEAVMSTSLAGGGSLTVYKPADFLEKTHDKVKNQPDSQTEDVTTTERTKETAVHTPFDKFDGKKHAPYYELADESGIIEYKGTVFICDDEHGALCLGDMSDESNVLSIPLAGGGTLKVNRDNKAELARAIGMFKPEDVRRIMAALAQDNKVQEMENEIEDEKNSIGTGQENQRKQE